MNLTSSSVDLEGDFLLSCHKVKHFPSTIQIISLQKTIISREQENGKQHKGEACGGFYISIVPTMPQTMPMRVPPRTCPRVC